MMCVAKQRLLSYGTLQCARDLETAVLESHYAHSTGYSAFPTETARTLQRSPYIYITDMGPALSSSSEVGTRISDLLNTRKVFFLTFHIISIATFK